MKQLFLALALALTAATGVQAQSKIAHVNSQKLLDTMPSRKAGAADIESIRAKGIAELTEMDAALQKMYADYMKIRPTLSPALQEYEEGRIQKKQAELEQYQTDLEQRIQLMSQDMNEKIYKKVKEAVDIVAKRKGLNYVMDESAALYVSGTDLTSEVIVELLKLDKAATATSPAPTPTPAPTGQK